MPDSMPVVDFLTRVTDDNGDPVSGGSIEFYDAGTNTPKEVFANAALSSSLGTSVDLDSSGYPVSSGTTRTLIYTGTDDYKVVVKDADGATLITHDNVPGAVATPATSAVALPSTPVLSKSANYTATSDDRGKIINCVTTGGAFTITLPSAVTVLDGWKICVRHDGSAYGVTIATVSSQTISYFGTSGTTLYLGLRGQSIWLVSNGANWIVDADAGPYIGEKDSVTPNEFAGSTVTDRLNAAATYANSNGLWVDLEGLTWTVGADGFVAPYKCRNGTIDGSAVVNSRSVAADGGSYPIIAYVACGDMFGGAWAYTTVTAPSKGATSLTVASSSGFAIGDECLIQKPTQWGNNSSSGYFSEAVTVLEITSGTVIRVAGGLKQAYTSGTGTVTLRKYPAVDVHWKDVTIIGSQTTDGVFGLMVTHGRFCKFERVRTEGCRRTGIAAFGCREAVFLDCDFERSDQGGLGYGCVTNSTNDVQVIGGSADRCREAVSGGGNFGTGKALTWNVQVTGLRGEGLMDAVVNQHPGCVNVSVSNIIAEMDPTALDEYGSGLTASGDGFLINAPNFSMSNCQIRNQRRAGIYWEPVQPGDVTNTLSCIIDNVSVSSTSTIAACRTVSIALTSASSTSVVSLISIRNVAGSCVNGIYIDYYDSTVKKLQIDGNNIEVAGTTGASTLESGVVRVTTSMVGATRPIDSISMNGGRYVHNTTSAGYATLYIQGLSTAVLPHMSVSGVRTVSGNYGIYVEHCTIDRWSHRSTGTGTASTATGTGGTINSTHST